MVNEFDVVLCQLLGSGAFEIHCRTQLCKPSGILNSSVHCYHSLVLKCVIETPRWVREKVEKSVHAQPLPCLLGSSVLYRIGSSFFVHMYDARGKSWAPWKRNHLWLGPLGISLGDWLNYVNWCVKTSLDSGQDYSWTGHPGLDKRRKQGSWAVGHIHCCFLTVDQCDHLLRAPGCRDCLQLWVRRNAVFHELFFFSEYFTTATKKRD